MQARIAYLRVIQGCYDPKIGFEDVSAYPVNSAGNFRSREEHRAFQSDWKAYIINEPTVAHRWITRRQKKEENK